MKGPGPVRAAIVLACLWTASAARAQTHAQTLALRCPMTGIAAEFLYDIDLATRTVQLAEPRTLPATVDATFVTWQDRQAGVIYRLTRGSAELMTAGTADGPWEKMAFCVPRYGI